MLFLHPLDLRCALLLKTIKDVYEEIAEHVQHFVVMLADCHFEIQPRELTQVSPRVRILRTEHRSHLEDAFESSACRRHLLVKLRTHAKTCWPAKVVKGEYISTSLTRPTQKFGRVNLNKVLGEQIFPKQRAHHTLNTENRLIRRCTEIDPTMIKACLLSHPSHFRGRVSLVIVRPDIRLAYEIGTASILHLEGHGRRGLVHAVIFRHLNLHLRLCGTLHGIFWHSQFAVDINNGFAWNARHVFDHGRWNILRFERHALYRVERRAKEDEGSLTNTAGCVQESTHEHLLSLGCLGQISNLRPASRSLLRFGRRLDHGCVAEDVTPIFIGGRLQLFELLFFTTLALLALLPLLLLLKTLFLRLLGAFGRILFGGRLVVLALGLFGLLLFGWSVVVIAGLFLVLEL
mmetsp:Transcript_18292/g.38411  ORF Transcript_18292/g.38411 Transcript_18292/m.38411 type:complete len:404 (-) Transcript_18292:357-1568(-)